MKTKLMIMMLAMLTLTACNNDDEPNSPDVNNIYLAVSNPIEIGYMVITAKGDTVYQCDPYTVIERLLADGRDWYAVTHQLYGNYHIVKNGNIIYSSHEETIIDMCVDDGNIYTLQEPYYEPVSQEWLCKNFTHIYSLPYGQFKSFEMVAHHGDVALAPVRSREACYWRNGELIAMQGLEGSLSNGHIDTDGDDVLIGIHADKNDMTGYWRNGTFSKLDSTIQILQVKLFGGKSYILGRRYTNGGIRITADAIIIVDGQEQVLRTGDKNNLALSMIRYNNDNYFLVREIEEEWRGNRIQTTETKSFIYKNMKPMKLSDDMTKLYIIDFAIIDK
jgi:hypothetical protein